MIRHAPSIGIGIGLSLRGSGPRFTGLLDSYPGAAAAYSLRALTSAWLAGDVVEVRRSSDSSTQSFTASQITNGDLVDYVKRPGDFTNDGFETFANNGTGDGFTAINTASVGTAHTASVSGTSSDVVVVDFDIAIVSGSPSLSLRSGAGAAPVESNLETITTSGSKSITLTATGSFTYLTFSEGDSPSEFTISNVRVSTNDGFVSTWYDQSGNGNDATQATTTSQPKIVSAGALVTGGLDFDGTDDWLSVVGNPVITASFSGVFSAFSVQNVEASEAGYLYGNASSTNGSSFYANISNFTLSNANIGTSLDRIARASGQNLLSSVYNNGDAGLLVNGGGSMIDEGTYTFATGTSDFIIGNRNGGTVGATYLDGQVAEIIIYNSDESTTRTAIETNINDHYSIY